MNKLIGFVFAALFTTGCPNPTTNDHDSPDMAKFEFPSQIASLSTTRVAASSAVGKDGTVYVIGGYGDKGNLASVEAYDPATNLWSLRASLPKSRFFGAAHAGVDGKILYFGGLTSTTGYTKDINVYDPASDSWSKLGDMNYQRSTITTAAAPDGKIYFIGGAAPDDPEIDRPDASGCSTLVESYDPATQQWKQYKRLAKPICDAAAAAGADGKIYLTGGYSGVAGSTDARAVCARHVRSWRLSARHRRGCARRQRLFRDGRCRGVHACDGQLEDGDVAAVRAGQLRGVAVARWPHLARRRANRPARGEPERLAEAQHGRRVGSDDEPVDRGRWPQQVADRLPALSVTRRPCPRT